MSRCFGPAARRWLLFALLAAAPLAVVGCGDIHPVYWNRTARAAASGDVDRIAKQAERDPYAGKYVKEYTGDLK